MAIEMSETRDLLVLYGSQTGTAADVAELLGRKAKAHHFQVRVRSMADYQVTDLTNESLVIFVVATAGQGDAPDNMKAFWRFLLRKQLPLDSLSQMDFTVFGLGDSSYSKYNYAAKKLHKRLLQLGAQQFYKRGLGDDQHLLGYDGELTPWQLGLWSTILHRYPLPPGQTVVDTLLEKPAPKYKCAVMAADLPSLSPNSTPEFIATPTHQPTPERPLYAKVLVNARITADDHWQDVRHIVLDTPSINYRPGDVCVVRPYNPPALVEWFIDYLGVDACAQFILTQADNFVNFPPPHLLPDGASVRFLLTHYLDLHAKPRGRYFFELLSHFAESEREVERLRQLSMPENLDELYDYCYRVKRTPQEVFTDFPSLRGNVPLSYLFDLFPAIQPRQFSIASSPTAYPNQVHLCAAIVTYQTRITAPRIGLCTNMLKHTKVGDHLKIWIVRGTICMPKQNHTPMLMIGPGTGVAPFRSFIGERLGSPEQANKSCLTIEGAASGSKGQCMLVFGNRKRDKDFLFNEDWAAYEKSGGLDLITAFSRDQTEKVYVQQQMMRRGEEIWDLIQSAGAYIYVCGNSKRMPDDVKKAIEHIVATHAPMAKEEAEAYVEQLETVRRLQLETWA
eukprot:CFRG2250T1